jgi:hypothetical protein
MILVHAASAAPQPWKNGGGVTRELLRLPAAASGADDWTLRISVADIAADGPFSPFPGVTRWFAVLEGAGVRLVFPDRVLNVHRSAAPLRFDGADAPGCTLLDGPTRDLNVMVRQDRGEALVTPATLLDEADPGPCAGFGFFATRPSILHGIDDSPMPLQADSLAWCEAPFRVPRPWRVEAARDNGGAQEHTVPGYWIQLLTHER